jgi:hypothetical protein
MLLAVHAQAVLVTASGHLIADLGSGDAITARHLSGSTALTAAPRGKRKRGTESSVLGRFMTSVVPDQT